MSNNKKNENESNDLTYSMNGVLDTLLTAFSVPEEPCKRLPEVAILGSGEKQPGLDKYKIYSEVIDEITKRTGIPTGDVFADGPNANDEMILLIIEKIIKNIHLDSVVNVVIPAGIPVKVSGFNSGGYMESVGVTMATSKGDGIIR